MHPKRRSSRPAFTLIEMLVVVAIIAVLMALTATAVMHFRGVGIGRATRTNLGKVHIRLTDQWRGVTSDANNGPLDGPFASKVGVGPGDRSNYVRMKQVQAFPTSFAEAFWPDPSWKPATPQATAPYAWQGYVSYLAAIGVTPANEATWGTTSQDTQCAICLLMILEKGPKNSGATADDLGSAVTRITFGPTRVPAVADSWQRPVVFTRTHGGNAASLAVLSAGGDGRFGVQLSPATFNVTNQGDARDNVLVTNP